jgi:hypothetical protein
VCRHLACEFVLGVLVDAYRFGRVGICCALALGVLVALTLMGAGRSGCELDRVQVLLNILGQIETAYAAANWTELIEQNLMNSINYAASSE